MSGLQNQTQLVPTPVFLGGVGFFVLFCFLRKREVGGLILDLYKIAITEEDLKFFLLLLPI